MNAPNEASEFRFWEYYDLECFSMWILQFGPGFAETVVVPKIPWILGTFGTATESWRARPNCTIQMFLEQRISGVQVD
jgi:hypothetical protein